MIQKFRPSLFVNIIISILLIFLIVSCDNTDLFSFAEEYSNYGPKWTRGGAVLDGGKITVTFPDDVINADIETNYIFQYSGAGSITRSFSYDATTRTATFILTFTNTDGSSFYIEFDSSSATPVTIPYLDLSKERSPLYTTPAPLSVFGWQPASGTRLNTSAAVQVEFSKDVINAELLANYDLYYVGSGSVTISSIAYNSTTRTATLTVISSATDGSLVYITIINGGTPITDGTTTLDGIASPGYLTMDTVAPTITGWSPNGGNTGTSPFDISITFSEDIINYDILTIYYCSGTTFSINSAVYNNATYTVTLNITMSGGSPNFTIDITGGYITDITGNSMASASSPSFTWP